MALNISNPVYHQVSLTKPNENPMINTVSINGKQYNLDTSNPKEMHLYNQYIAIQKKMIIAKLEYEQLDVAYQVFGQNLLNSINNKEQDSSKEKDISEKEGK